VNTKQGLWLDAVAGASCRAAYYEGYIECGLTELPNDTHLFHSQRLEPCRDRLGRGTWKQLRSEKTLGRAGRRTSRDSYVAKLMTDPVLEEHTKRSRCRSIYFITGVMVTEHATIVIKTEFTSVYNAKVTVNKEGLGVPAKS
jgi:hypothetical protein